MPFCSFAFFEVLTVGSGRTSLFPRHMSEFSEIDYLTALEEPEETDAVDDPGWRAADPFDILTDDELSDLRA